MAEEQQQVNKLVYRGCLKGHNGWVTCMKIGEEEVGKDSGSYKEFLLSGSRDNTLIIWDLRQVSDADDDQEYGTPRKVLTGHSHFISDLDLS